MRFMRSLLAFALLFTAVAAVSAQGQRGGLPPMFDQLNLTEEQKGKIQPIWAEAAKQIRAIRQDSALADADKQAKIKPINKERDQKINDILTAEQRDKLKQLRKEQAAKNQAQAAQQPKPEPKKP